jgi:deoxyribodipyrimidine photo-lyase
MTKNKKYQNGLFIFRRDLRIQDNKGLKLLNDECEHVYTIFIFTPEQVGNTNKYKSNNCVQFMIESLQNLNTQLGGKLYCFYGKNNNIIYNLIKELEINVIGFNLDYTPYAMNRDIEIMDLCGRNNVEILFENDYYLNEPGTILSGGGTPYLKFTPYYTQASKKRVDNPSNLSRFSSKQTSKRLKNIISLSTAMSKFTKINENLLIKGGRTEGIKQLKESIKTQKHYSRTRDDISYNTSLLSAYIKFGCLSIREVYKAFNHNKDFIRQLHWRDFYAQVMYFNPQVIGGSLKENYNKIKWHNSGRLFKAWCDGKTGFPIVDAAMRQLNTVGWMHNRGRMIVSSFLTKILLIDWRLGERYFATKLVDYDPANNNGGWQWSAGTGADSQPYFRIFNPFLQSQNHDPDCEYIKRWVPELVEVPNEIIHNWDDEEKIKKMNMNNERMNNQESTNKIMDIKYPRPIVDYSEQKEKALKMYKEVY